MATTAILRGRTVLRHIARSSFSLSTTTAKRHHAKHVLQPVGSSQPVKVEGKYLIGQLFAHKVLDYRGVVLFPWVTRINDKDVDTNNSNGNGKKNRITSQVYYQVLIDQRDIPYLPVQLESFTPLVEIDMHRGRLLFLGFDQLSHEDMLPYKSTDKVPIYSEYINKLLIYHPGEESMYKPTETLRNWQEKKTANLQLSNVYKQTTEHVTITVIPFFVDALQINSRMQYLWRYSIRIQNKGKLKVQLREREWKIFSYLDSDSNVSPSSVDTVKGRGVVGHEPILKKNQVFQYCSEVSLKSPRGEMWGLYKMEREDGERFEVHIPSFSLLSSPDIIT